LFPSERNEKLIRPRSATHRWVLTPDTDRSLRWHAVVHIDLADAPLTGTPSSRVRDGRRECRLSGRGKADLSDRDGGEKQTPKRQLGQHNMWRPPFDRLTYWLHLNLQRFMLELVAGAGFHHYLRSQQVMMVAGPGHHISANSTLSFIAELMKQIRPANRSRQAPVLFAAMAWRAPWSQPRSAPSV